MQQMNIPDRLALVKALGALNRRATRELASFGHIRPETNQARELINGIVEAESSPRLVVQKPEGGT